MCFIFQDEWTDEKLGEMVFGCTEKNFLPEMKKILKEN